MLIPTKFRLSRYSASPHQASQVESRTHSKKPSLPGGFFVRLTLARAPSGQGYSGSVEKCWG